MKNYWSDFKRYFFIYSFLYFLVFNLQSENLPATFHFSNDGLRLIRGNITNTGFYDWYTIDTIYIELAQSNFWTLLTNNYNSKADLLGTLKYKGETYDSVGVRFKGQTSYSSVKGEKKSFNITLDIVKENQNIDGYSTFNLNNAASDPSFMREFLYNYFQSINSPCAKTNYKILVINGISWGLYVNVQQLDKQHVREWFTDADATRWRAEKVGGMTMSTTITTTTIIPTTVDSIMAVVPGGGGTRPGGGGIPDGGGNPGGGDLGSNFGAGKSSLNYLGDDTSSYTPNYTLKHAYKSDPWDDLVKACKVLNTISKDSLVDTLNKVLDIDAALWFIAHEIIFTDEDSYVYKGGMDYTVYFDQGTNRIVPIEMDGNETFITNEASTMSIFYKEDNASYPLMNVLLKVPELRQRYLAHVRTILEQSFNLEKSDSIIDYYAALIDKYVSNDTKKIYTYTEFKSDAISLKSFLKNRRSYILSNSEVSKVGPAITNVIYKAGEEDYSVPDSTQEVKITANVSCSEGISKVYLYYDKGIAGKFKKVEMLDDGLNNDGTTGDGTYGAVIPPHDGGKYMRFYIEAVAAGSVGTSSYSPAGAEHDVYVYRVKVATTVENSNVVINELMCTNSYTESDQDGEFDDWIELYNKSNEDIDLSGYYLANGDGNLTKWQFPSNSIITANGYLTIWADKDSTQVGLHTNFKLSSKGEEIFLVSPDTVILDNVVYSAQKSEVSFSRLPNGTGPFGWTTPTFALENKQTVYIITSVLKASVSKFTIYPNPASNLLTIATDNSIGSQYVNIYNLSGIKVIQSKFSGTATMNLSSLPNGMYIVRINDASVRLVVLH
jgi:hypothetical protein